MECSADDLVKLNHSYFLRVLYIFFLGVPLLDGGTVRLPQLIGLSLAMDMILTGRPVDAKEAFNCGKYILCG